MERRSFLGALTAASLGVALDCSFTKFARAQNTAQVGANSAGFQNEWISPELNNSFGAWSLGRRLVLAQRHSAFRTARSSRHLRADPDDVLNQ